MRALLLAGLLLATWPCLAQEPTSEARETPADGQRQTSNTQSAEPIRIPAGTTVPVALTNPIRTRTAKKGDAVRVVTAFPVTVGTALAIPAGTYLEGVIDKIQKQKGVHPARMQMHFTRMLFSNGYEVPLTSATAVAGRMDTGENSPGSGATRNKLPAGSSGFMATQFPPPPSAPPPPPNPGPSIGKAVGIGLGVTAALAVVGIMMANNRGVDSEFEVSTQFDLIFQTEISLQRNRVPASAGGLE